MDETRPDTPPFRVLFVCTGNTCRSPLAEALARRAVEARGWSHVEVGSAGVHALPGEAASEGAQRVAAEEGIDLSGHRSRPLGEDELSRADLILAMTPSHLVPLASSGAGERATLLTAFASGGDGSADVPAGVPDPFGGDDETYRETLHTLERLVELALDRLEPILAP